MRSSASYHAQEETGSLARCFGLRITLDFAPEMEMVRWLSLDFTERGAELDESAAGADAGWYTGKYGIAMSFSFESFRFRAESLQAKLREGFWDNRRLTQAARSTSRYTDQRERRAYVLLSRFRRYEKGSAGACGRLQCRRTAGEGHG